MIKGSNRRMFRRPGSARKAAGILASSRELMNQVEPIRMDSGGLQNDAVAQRDFLAEYEKLLLERAKKQPFSGNFLTDLGLGAVTASLQNPNLGTLESIAAGLTQALPMQTKRRQAEDARELALLEGQMKIETARKAREKEKRDQATSEAAIFKALYTEDQREALSMMGFTPDFKSGKFKDAKGDLYSISEIQEDEKLSKQYNAQLDATKTTVGERFLTNFQDADTYNDAMNNLAGFAAQQRDEDIAAQDIQRNAPIIADKFAPETKEKLEKENPDATVQIEKLNVGAYSPQLAREGTITGGHGAAIIVTSSSENAEGQNVFKSDIYDPGGNLLKTITTITDDQNTHDVIVRQKAFGASGNKNGLIR